MDEKLCRAEVFMLINRELHKRNIAEGGDSIIPEIVFEIIDEVEKSYAN